MKKWILSIAAVIVGFVAFDLAFGQDVYNSKYTQYIVNKVFFKTTAKAEFRDIALYINSSADGQLDIVADATVDISCDSVHVDSILSIDGFKVEVGTDDSLLFISGTDTFVIRTKR